MKTLRLLIILDSPNKMEIQMGRPLAHDGGRLLVWLTRKLSIPRDRWVHTYVYNAKLVKGMEPIPTKQWERRKFLEPHIEELSDFISIQPSSIVGMGKLIGEITTLATHLKDRAGTHWIPMKSWRDVGMRKIWLTYGPDAALFNPELIVQMCRVIGKAAMEAGIDVKLNQDIDLYNWSKYL